MSTLSIDIETYSDVDIAHGVYKYVDSPEFEILLIGYAFDDEPVRVVDLTQEEVPARFRRALFDRSITKTAYNANFEMTCFKKFYPDMPLDCWECTSVLALYWSYPSGLDNVAKALGLPDDKQKDARGKALIRYFSKPCKPTKSNGHRTRNYPADAPEKWAEYIEYNRQDVEVERAIRKKLIRLKPSETEHKLWLMDQKINAYGAYINKPLVYNAIRMDREYKTQLLQEAKEVSGLPNPNSVSQLKTWIKQRTGREVTQLNKAAIDDALKRDDLPADVRTVLSIRRRIGKTSVKKFQAMAGAVTSDGRIHGMFQFYGAMRTGRWAGRIVQLHNLARNKMDPEDLDAARNLVIDGDLETLMLCYGNVSDILSQLIRTAIEAKPGTRLIVDDYSAIEARVIAWLAGEKWRQEVFANNGDIYCASASAMFGVPVVKHGVNGHLRQKGKIAELALGYGGSVGAMKAMGAEKMGLNDSELEEIVRKWRQNSPHIVDFWYQCENAALDAIKHGTETLVNGRIRFSFSGGNMLITLPSGRQLVYINPTLGENRFGGTAIKYRGVQQATRKWGWLETYGGKLVENIVQATARDCLAMAMYRLTQAGYHILMHIHDEVVMEMPIGVGSRDEVTRIMCECEPWEKGLIKNADGFEGPYYLKD